MPFDVDGAKKAGYSDAEIADYLAKGSNYDAAGARKAGYTDAQIIGHLTMDRKPPEPPKPEGLGAQVEAGIRDIPRQVGLTARHGIEGATGALGFAVDPFLNIAGLPTVAGGGRQIANMLELPTPQNKTERLVGDVSRMMAGAGGFAGAAGQLGKATSGGAKPILEAIAAKPATQVAAGAGAGAGAGYMRETGGGPRAQFAGGLLGSIAGGGVPAASSAVLNGIKSAGRSVTGGALGASSATPQAIDIRISQVIEPQLRKSGMTWGDLPNSVKVSLRNDASEALKLGKTLDDDALRRLADYRLTGLTPTKGTITQNPSQLTQEKNLAKATANIGVDGLPSVQHVNMTRLVSNLDEAGAAKSLDRLSVGDKMVGAIKSKDARAQAYENKLYSAARDTEGRAAPLDRAGFINRADELLASDGKHAFLPDAIKTKLNQISRGQIEAGGKSYDVPFNVDVINSLKSELATAQRSASDGNVRRAIGLVRQALDETPISGDVPAASMKAFDKARAFARARRNWQESAPAIEDALNGIPPDRFVEQYVIGQTGKASAGSVSTLANELRKAGVQADVKNYIVAYLKKQATGDSVGSASADASRFSAPGYSRALDQIGDAKLKLFFTPEEVSQLKAVARVAKYETAQPTGSAVNNSNTAATAFAHALDMIGNNKLLSRLPFGDAALRQPAQNWAAQIQTRQALNAPAGLAVSPQQQNGVLPGSALVGPMLVAPGLLSNR